MSTVSEKAKRIIEQWSLLKHPFYQAWTEGTLAAEKLRSYAQEYGSFISLIAGAWNAGGYPEIAGIERDHAKIWEGFANSLGTTVQKTTSIRQVAALNKHYEQSCNSKAAILGALLAFEYQQPTTVASKLQGLRSHYANLNADETYFEIHLDDWDEPALLISDIEDMDTKEQAEALFSLESACMLLWSALSGIYDCDAVAA